jgi:hypothetical protein
MKNAIINSLPKSGTNLFSDLMKLLGYDFGGHIGSGLMPNSLLRSVFKKSWKTKGIIVGVNMPVEVSSYEVIKILKKLSIANTYITAHVGYNDHIIRLISQLQLNVSPFIITRDPRAVLNSFVHYVSRNDRHPLHRKFLQSNDVQRYKLALNGFVDNKNSSLVSLYSSCLAVYPWMKNNKVTNIKFEDLIGEKGGGSREKQFMCIKNVCESLELNKNDDEIEFIISDLFGKNDNTFRKGKVDSWKTEIPEQLLDDVNKELADILKNWGY